MQADGSDLIAWTTATANGLDVHAQAFAATGALDGGEFVVNTTTANDQEDPAAAWAGGSAIIAWDGSGAGDSAGIFLQRYTTSGAINQATVITVPGAQAIYENNTVTFSPAGGDAISVADSRCRWRRRTGRAERDAQARYHSSDIGPDIQFRQQR